MNDFPSFVRSHTALVAPPLVPELRLWTATEITPLWEATEAFLEKAGIEPPFWAFAWPGSQGLARWILDNPAVVAGRRVLDVGSGNGLAAIAAARAGGEVTANDVDPVALVATHLNAEENGVTLVSRLGDLTLLDPATIDAEVVLVGDLCYEKALAERLLGWLSGLAKGGRRVLVSEPGRAFAPRAGVRPVARFTVPTTLELESRTERETVILEVEG